MGVFCFQGGDMGKTCSFFGHRKIEITEKLKRKLDIQIEFLIEEKGVDTFLFGSRSQFDDLCHERVTLLQAKYPHIKRIAYVCGSEYACMEDEREELERITRTVTKWDIKYKAYDGVRKSERLCGAGRASYVERNQDMINASDYCVFYEDPYYLVSKRSGTRLALEYAYQKKRGGKDITIINLYEENQ